MLEEVIRQNIVQYRKIAGLSQEKLSEKLDKNINYINTIESKRAMPSIQMLEEIARALNVEPWQLLKPERCKTKEEIAQDMADDIKNVILSHL